MRKEIGSVSASRRPEFKGRDIKNEHPSTDMVSREPSLRVMWEVKRKLTAGSEGKCQIGSSERLFKKKVQTLIQSRTDQK